MLVINVIFFSYFLIYLRSFSSISCRFPFESISFIHYAISENVLISSLLRYAYCYYYYSNTVRRNSDRPDRRYSLNGARSSLNYHVSGERDRRIERSRGYKLLRGRDRKDRCTELRLTFILPPFYLRLSTPFGVVSRPVGALGSGSEAPPSFPAS